MCKQSKGNDTRKEVSYIYRTWTDFWIKENDTINVIYKLGDPKLSLGGTITTLYGFISLYIDLWIPKQHTNIWNFTQAIIMRLGVNNCIVCL